MTNDCTVQFDEFGQVDQKDDLLLSELDTLHEREGPPLPTLDGIEQRPDPGLGDSRLPRGTRKLRLVPKQFRRRGLDATLDLGGAELTGVDPLPHEFARPQGFSVTLTVEGADRAKEIFTALVEEGETCLAFVPTFWSPGFGVLVDRFGVPWEINAAEAAQDVS